LAKETGNEKVLDGLRLIDKKDLDKPKKAVGI